MQGIIILATIRTEKHTLVFYSKKNLDKSQWSVTCRSRVPGQGGCLICKARTITLQGFIILATISTDKYTLVFYSMSRHKILTKLM